MNNARLSHGSRQGNIPAGGDPEDPDLPSGRGLLSARAAVILGTSFFIAVIAGALAYLALGRSTASMAGGILAAGTAFAGAIRLLNYIIA